MALPEYLSPMRDDFQKPSDVGLSELWVENDPTNIQSQLLRSSAATVPIEVGSEEFGDLLAQFERIAFSDSEMLLPAMQAIDSRTYHSAGYERNAFSLTADGRVAGDAKRYFHASPLARDAWADLTLPDDVQAFIRACWDMQEALSPAIRRAVADLDVGHPGLYEAFFPNAADTIYKSEIGIPVMRLVVYDATEELETEIADLSLEVGKLPVGKPHLDLSALSFRMFANDNGLFGIRHKKDSADLEVINLPQVDREAHVFLGQGWSNLFQGDTDLKPLEHMIVRLEQIPASESGRRMALVVLLRPVLIDVGEQGDRFAQHNYTPDELGRLAVLAKDSLG